MRRRDRPLDDDLISRPDRFLLVAGLLFGLGLAVVTPPFQVPDEPAHFYRAYRVSEGRLDLMPPPKYAGAELPASLQRIAEELSADLPFHEENKTAPAKIVAAFQVPLDPDRRVPVWFPNSLQYPFVPYVPQALGIALGRLFGVPPAGGGRSGSRRGPWGPASRRSACCRSGSRCGRWWGGTMASEPNVL